MSKNTPMGQSWAKESSCFDVSLRWKIPTDIFLLQQHLLLVVLLLKVVRNTRTTNLRGHLINCLEYSFSTFREHVVIIRLSTNWSVSDTCLQIWNMFKFYGNRLEIPHQHHSATSPLAWSASLVFVWTPSSENGDIDSLSTLANRRVKGWVRETLLKM